VSRRTLIWLSLVNQQHRSRSHPRERSLVSPVSFNPLLGGRGVLATVDAADIRGLSTARLLCVAELPHSRHGHISCALTSLTSSRILHLVTVPPRRPLNEIIVVRAVAYAPAGRTSRAIAHTNPASSRAIAVATFGFGLPRATSRRNRPVSRNCAFHAMSHTILGNAS
jgi:hypothetical protein